MTAGGSHTATTLSQRQLRLMRSKLKIIAISWYKIATFDLIRSGLSRTTFPSRGRLFLCPASPCVDFILSNIPGWLAGHAAAPTKPRRGIFLEIRRILGFYILRLFV